MQNLLDEKEYLEINSAYHIEKQLLQSFKKEDIKEFILPLYTEYKEINQKISEELEKSKKEYGELDEVSEYFIEQMTLWRCWGERKEELEHILYKFNSCLYSKEPRSKKQHIREKIDIGMIPIEAIISKYTTLPKNKNQNIKCPFPDHTDNTASFKIYNKTNSFYCFWCCRGWNVINFISYMEWISTKEAYRRLEDAL